MDRVESKPVRTLAEKVKVYEGEAFVCAARCRLQVRREVIVTAGASASKGMTALQELSPAVI